MREMRKVYVTDRDLSSHDFAKWLLTRPDVSISPMGGEPVVVVDQGGCISIDDMDYLRGGHVEDGDEIHAWPHSSPDEWALGFLELTPAELPAVFARDIGGNDPRNDNGQQLL